MTVLVEATLLCDGVFEETVLGRVGDVGSFGLYEGECRSGRSRNAVLTGPAKEVVLKAAEAAGWYLEPHPDGIAQCPDCRALSPFPEG